ncbi:MAG: tRNA uridine-5-carboxymethylaminomethyl(34) synthesis GTPase MnmE [Candidatus Eremiobacterota bacterium]
MVHSVIDDTIAAISTPPGEGGIGIIRLSGPLSVKIISAIFSSAKESISVNSFESHRLYYGYILEPSTGERVDEVLLSVMKAPRTYTREDIVEINSHSGIIVLKKILNIVLTCGARLAEPGEFTKRAFLNGRIDLTQAEAVMDLIRARTDASLKVAMNQVEGKLSGEIKDIYKNLADLLAHIEADIDYPEDDISPVDFSYLHKKISNIIADIEELINTADYGKILREGIKVAIVGRPNAGKSSLLNGLLGENRAIVTDIPGTTRDTIEEYLNLEGFPVEIIDTAGIRKTIDIVETIGVNKTYEIMDKADLILYLIDASQDFHEEDLEIINNIPKNRLILVFNKIDLPGKIDMSEVFLSFTFVETSLLSEEGVNKIKKAILSFISRGHVSHKERIFISNLRHRKALVNCKMSLLEFNESFENGFSSDIIAIDLKKSLDFLGEITGDNVTDDVLSRIFENFCVGK